MMDGFNDSPTDSTELARLLKTGDRDWIVKLNPLLETEGDYRPSSRSDEFERSLVSHGINVNRYHKVGSTIRDNHYSQLTYERNEVHDVEVQNVEQT